MRFLDYHISRHWKLWLNQIRIFCLFFLFSVSAYQFWRCCCCFSYLRLNNIFEYNATCYINSTKRRWFIWIWNFFNIVSSIFSSFIHLIYLENKTVEYLACWSLPSNTIAQQFILVSLLNEANQRYSDLKFDDKMLNFSRISTFFGEPKRKLQFDNKHTAKHIKIRWKCEYILSNMHRSRKKNDIF